MADRQTNARFRTLLDGLRAAVAGEMRALVFVAAVVGLLMLLRQVVQFAVDNSTPTITLSELASGWWEDFEVHGVAALVMFCLIQPVRRLGPSGGARRIVLLAVAVVLAAALATLIRFYVLLLGGEEVRMLWSPVFVGTNIVRFLVPAALLVTVAEFNRREIISLEAMRAAEADRSALEQETLQARLKTLEAQIEPHFLFNTLANVRRLYETDAVAGETMLQLLMRYLVVALPSMRDELPTLGREAQLIEAYLELQHVRMGRRLSYRVDIAPALRGITVPSMMLLTLVENAIKHGLAPLREGGRIDIGARIDGDHLQLEVADTGRGFGGDSSGMGTGLANIRARLTAMFGDAAGLTLMSGPARGLLATIRMPLRPAS